PGLFDLDRLEQRLEVADPEPARAMALDDLEEECRPVLDRAGEDLEEVALLVSIGLDAEFLERVDRDPDVADALAELLVVRVGHSEELDAEAPQRSNRPDDVLGPEGDVLRSGLAVVIEELLDLALLLAGRRLVDRELDAAVAVGHDLRHQRAVLGVDDLVVVVDELGKPEDVAIEVDEAVHVAELDVSDAMVDLEQIHALRRRGRFLDLAEAGRQHAAVVPPVDEGMADRAIRVDR